MPSTSLRDIVYDPTVRTLDVTFISSGKRYRYFDVAPEEHDALRRAFSKGTHFNREIKPRHRFAVLEERHQAQGPFLRPYPMYSTAASHGDNSDK